MRGHRIDDRWIDSIYDNEENNPDRINNKNIFRYRTKTIKSGDVLEVQAYPIWNTYSEVRRAKNKVSTIAQSNLNHRNRQAQVIRLINANFTDKDVWATFTYSDEKMPTKYSVALKEIKNYIRRLKTYAAKHNYPELKYIYVTEFKKHGFHHHIVMNFKDRDIAEKLWKGGKRKQTRRLQADVNGYEGIARYITKQETKELEEDGIKHNAYVCSKNLIKPKITVSDWKISRSKARKIAEGRLDPMKLFQRLYPGYTFNTCEVKTSEYVSGCYLYVKLHKFRN